jgi:hypothetical protein
VDIATGYQVEQPPVLVPWGITREELESLFQGFGLRQVGDGYWLPKCTSLGGLSHSLGFRFGRTSDRLSEIALHVPDVSLDESYRRLQQHLVAMLGPPTKTSPGEEEERFPQHTWSLPAVRIEHYVHEHFGPSERVFIRKDDQDF